MLCFAERVPMAERVTGGRPQHGRVGKLCDAGLKVEFGKSAAIVTHGTTGRKICEFKRENGLYMGAMQLKNPDFIRQAAHP